MRWNLDRILGPREWSVVREEHPWGEADTYAILTSRLIEADEVLATGLRAKAARRLAKRLRAKSEQAA